MDLNGNVTLLVNIATGQAAATYDYGPFGEPLRQSGEYAMLNPFRFSTKYTDDETGMVDYGHRPYIPSLGRWPSKDPVGEDGGVNLYGFVGNDGIGKLDYLGNSITEYTVDTESIPLEIGQIPGGALASTNVRMWEYSGEVSLTNAAYFGSGLFGKNEVLKLKGTLTIEITKKKGVADDFIVEKHKTGYTVAQHEHHHAWICKRAYNNGAKIANSFEGKYCSGCGEKAKRLALAYMGLLKERQIKENQEFDYYDYSIDRRTAIDGLRYTAAENELKDARKDYNLSKCKKL